MNNAALQKLLGYLNLSSGAPDPQLFRSVNEAFGLLSAAGASQAPWRALGTKLDKELAALSAASAPGFESIDQASAVLPLVFQRLLAEYRAFHSDLLGHHSDAELWQPFFIAKAIQAVLREQPPWPEGDRIIAGAIEGLNSFIGHRPVAVLRTAQKIEPYPHEWVCPLPLYVVGAGVAQGRYHDLIVATLDILRTSDRRILDQACFDPELLNELALDPRAYDFDHPVNKRPNYQFGQWDPHAIDNSGNYRRFVLQAVTLDALLERVDDSPGDKGELLAESAAVLAGTMLMAAGVSGRGPETHDSTTTLANLLPRIAAYRDEFYRSLLARFPGHHGDRLRTEAQTLRQPFGGARHDLNQRLARLRAVQLQHVHLARLFAAIGNLDASSRQAQVVPVASARMLSEISGRITIGHLALARGNVNDAAQHLAEADDLLKRAIQCGAVVDPWNILGFHGQFSLFPGLENSVRDHRVDVLIHLVTQMLNLAVQTAAEAAAVGADDALSAVTQRLSAIAQWWDGFATFDVSSVESVSGRESVDAANAVVTALTAWRQAGATGGDIAFWRKHVSRFHSPRAYALVIQTLLVKRDFVAAMGLLVQWLSESEQTSLSDGEASFHRLSQQWLTSLLPQAETGEAEAGTGSERWALAAKFFDYLEANAGDYWEAPRLAFAATQNLAPADEDDDEDGQNRFDAAYEGVTYLDTTDDGVEGATLSGDEQASDYELELESGRLRSRLAFLRTLARLRVIAAINCGAPPQANATEQKHSGAKSLTAQLDHSVALERGLVGLLSAIDHFRIPQPSAEHSSLVEYDRRRRVKESLLADVASATVESGGSVRWIRAAISPAAHEQPDAPETAEATDRPRWEVLATPVLRGILDSDPERVRAAFPALRAELESRPILYVPLARGGDPEQLVLTLSIKQLVVDLLVALPRLGLPIEACQLIATAYAMERHRPKGDRVVTEFDRLFEVGYRPLVESIVDAAAVDAQQDNPQADTSTEAKLVECLQALTQPLLQLWLEHSRSVRLSVLERVAEPDRWQALVKFIETYGHDLFTQKFLNLGRLRAILDQGADAYLRLLEENPDPAHSCLLTDDLSAGTLRGFTRAEVVEHLQTVVEAVVENYAEYKDFNTTTTQSDHGELLYTLLDFLRLKASNERVCWNIRPIVQAHEILVRRGQLAAAELWRRALAEQTTEAADALLKQASTLADRYQMRLPSITARLAERFVRPLAVDGMRALVRPAIDEVRTAGPGEAFARLEQEIAEFADQPTGSGLEVPPWLAALEEEAALAQMPIADRESADVLARRLKRVPLSLAEYAQLLRQWDE
ncbi:MAG TPA: hypothetical protein VGG64_27480 [Pirellulales bacterium]|jgi:hypothetical protein